MVQTIYNDETCWEANVMPDHEIAQVKVYGKEISLTTPLTPLAAKVNTITINVSKVINPDDLPDEINNVSSI